MNTWVSIVFNIFGIISVFIILMIYYPLKKQNKYCFMSCLIWMLFIIAMLVIKSWIIIAVSTLKLFYSDQYYKSESLKLIESKKRDKIRKWLLSFFR